MVMTEELQTLAATKATRRLERAALEMGMRTLWDDGLAKVAAGLTTVEGARPRDGLIAAECHEKVTTSARTRAEPDL